MRKTCLLLLPCTALINTFKENLSLQSTEAQLKALLQSFQCLKHSSPFLWQSSRFTAVIIARVWTEPCLSVYPSLMTPSTFCEQRALFDLKRKKHSLGVYFSVVSIFLMGTCCRSIYVFTAMNCPFICVFLHN